VALSRFRVNHRRGIEWCAFNPNEGDGGGVSTGERINLHSGMLNPDLMAPFGPEADAAWKKASVRTWMDSGIAHEYEEGNGYSHHEAIERAPDTELPISHEAREPARKIRDGNRRR
jgi:hypothetical protein